MISRKRTTNACQQCQQRKRRCDGAEPCCNHCRKHGRHCVYTVRRWRGPGKSKESNRPFIQQHYQSRSFSGPDLAPAMETNASRGYNRLSGDMTAQVSSEGRFTGESTDSGINDSNQSPLVGSETTRTLASVSKQFTVFSDDIRKISREMKIQMNKGCFEKKVFTSLPPKDHILDLMQPVIEEIQLHGVFLTKESALNRLTEQYIAGLDDCYSDPDRWATVCSLLGISVLHRAANGSVAALSSMAWAFFKNAFAIYAELAIRGPGIFSCEALLAMILFMLRTADACVTAQLTATAARSIHMLGLHKHEHYIDVDVDVAESQKRIFWATYIANADVAHRYGLPSPLCVEDVVIGLPGHEHHHVEDILQPQQADLLRHRAVLAVAQLRIHKLLQHVLSRPIYKRKSSDLLEAIKATDEELEAWKRSLPTSIQPGFRSCGMPLLEMPIALLHYIYFSCISKVSMAVVLLSNAETCDSVSEEEQARALNTILSSSGIARARCAMAARGTLDVLFRLQPQPFTHLWQTLCFPLSAVLILLFEILEHPASVHAETDAQLIHDFVGYLERLQKEGSDVRRLLDGCNRFSTIVTCAIIAAKPGEQTIIFEKPVEVQSLQSRLAQVEDWLQLAHGLLSNMPALYSKARKVFCDILEPPQMDETYGDFVPDFLKSHNHGFSFSK